MSTQAIRQYFDYFEKVTYGSRTLVNLTQRIVFLKYVRENEVFVGEYLIKDGETMWSLAQDFYGSENYYWLIGQLNDIVDPFFDWPLPYYELQRLIDAKYPGSEKEDIHHWLLDGRIFKENPGHPLAQSVSNKDYEEYLNETRRRIKILRPEYLTQAIAEFDKKARNFS